MTSELILTNAIVVTPEDASPGTVLVRNGSIAAIDRGRSGVSGAIDCEGDYLLPGLIEMHTDNLEKHVSPRPGVRWPMQAAVLAHDAQIAAAGITTVYDALTVGEVRDDATRAEMLGDAVAAIAAGQRAGRFRAEHLLHLRCEVGSEAVVSLAEKLLQEPLVRLVSLMDHTPGQRQFATVEKYNEYYKAHFGYRDGEISDFLTLRIERARRYANDNRRTLARLCNDLKLATASHDDATVDHVEEAFELGVTISEFPTTREAAEVARRRGMVVVMGAPNLVRGGSHFGNISALELAESSLLDVLSSDYVPFSLLHATFLLHQRMGLPLAEAVAKVSINPAAMLGLEDRGAIACERRADLVRTTVLDDMPVPRQVWRAGQRIL